MDTSDVEHLQELEPLDFLQRDDERAAWCSRAASGLFAWGKSLEARQLGQLDQLLLTGFDDEQVWQMLELRNKPLLRYVQTHARKLKPALEREIDEAEEGERRAAAAAAAPDEEEDSGEEEGEEESGEEGMSELSGEEGEEMDEGDALDDVGDEDDDDGEEEEEEGAEEEEEEEAPRGRGAKKAGKKVSFAGSTSEEAKSKADDKGKGALAFTRCFFFFYLSYHSTHTTRAER